MGLFNGPPVTDAQRDLVAMTDARTREWYLEAEIAMLNMRIAELEAALKPFADASDLHLGSDDMSIAFRIIIGDLRQARKALGEKE
jgi:hypothetical protein